MLRFALVHAFHATLYMLMFALAHAFHATLQMLVLALAHVLDAMLSMSSGGCGGLGVLHEALSPH